MYELLVKSAYAAYTSNLIGNPCIATERRFEFFKNPKVGDLVLEITTINHPKRDITHNLGRLVRIEKSPNGNPFKDKWVIRTLYHDREFAWHNADFIRVLDIDESFE